MSFTVSTRGLIQTTLGIIAVFSILEGTIGITTTTNPAMTAGVVLGIWILATMTLGFAGVINAIHSLRKDQS